MKSQKIKTYPQLRKDLKEVFNKFIRLRDQGKPCIACGKYHKLQAGHFISVGSSRTLEFNEDNVHGECAGCNTNENQTVRENYERNLRERIGNERVDRLYEFAKIVSKKNRFILMDMIEYYKKKVKEIEND